MEALENRPNGRVLSLSVSAIGPAPPAEPAQTRVSNRARSAARPYKNAPIATAPLFCRNSRPLGRVCWTGGDGVRYHWCCV